MKHRIFNLHFSLSGIGKIKIFLIIFITLLIPVDALLFYNLKYLGKTFPNIYINSLSVSGKNKLEIESLIQETYSQLPSELNLKDNNQTFTLQTSPFEVVVQANQTADQAFNIGRNENIWQNVRTRMMLLNQASTIPLVISLNEKSLDMQLASVSAVLDEPTIPPTINIISINNTKSATVSAGRPGKTLDVVKVKEEIVKAYQTMSFDPINLHFRSDAKSVTTDQLEQSKNIADKLLNKTLTMQFEDNSWNLEDEALINFLSVYDTFDNNKIASWSAEVAKTINREPENALFNWDGQRVTEFKPAKRGVSLKTDSTIQSIQNGIQYLANSAEPQYTFQLSVLYTEPKVTTDKVNDLGIKELIGKGESWFYHSISTRIHNLTLASSKFHGVLIAPGEEFSMLKILGNIDASQGYKPAYIIQNGRTILGDGGGVCQTSTTMFRAALDAGLDITVRFPHAYRVSYYEANYDVGVDASVFSPTADFKFINDTPGHILIQTFVDPDQMYMHYDFYGTSDGRQVERSKSRIWDQTPPPPELYQDDPTLPNGTVKQVDWAAWGAKTAFDWKVTRNGEIIHEKTFYSTYRPWQAVYLKGTAQ